MMQKRVKSRPSKTGQWRCPPETIRPVHKKRRYRIHCRETDLGNTMFSGLTMPVVRCSLVIAGPGRIPPVGLKKKHSFFPV